MSGIRMIVVDGIPKFEADDEEQGPGPTCSDQIIDFDENAQSITVRNTATDFSGLMDKYKTVIMGMSLPHENADKIFSATKKLLESYTDLCEVIFSKCGKEEGKKELIEYIARSFDVCATRFQREKNHNTCYIQPKELAVGLEWKYTAATGNSVPRHYMRETKFVNVSILAQLKKLLEDSHFRKIYTDYNQMLNSVPANKYSSYASAQNFKKSDFFKENPMALQLQLAMDDCELCCALKTKTGIHKICCVYMQIVNLPPEYLSKLESIYLVSLSISAHTKVTNGGLSAIWEPIVSDLKELETIGIQVTPEMNIKGALVNVCYDNLGGNTIYGMVQSFGFGAHTCRHCESNKDQIQSPQLHPELTRTIQKYDEYLSVISRSEGKVDTKQTKGFTGRCFLNDLKYFHILENNSLDLMHDFNEGVIQYCLSDFFTYITKTKIVSLDELTARIRDFDYGFIYRKNKPSLLNTDKKNLNQNASQTYCLAIFIPFILKDLEAQLMCNRVWSCVGTLLRIMQIVYSNSIDEIDLNHLEKLVPEHLNAIKNIFGVHLKPKHHNTLHYADVIRKMGAPKSMWMMR